MVVFFSEVPIALRALICIVVNRTVDTVAACKDATGIDHQLIEAIEAQLNEGDVCTFIEPADIVVDLTNTTESDAMQFSRLARNAFQRFYSSRREHSLSIGVVLHEKQEAERNDLLSIAYQLVEKADKTTGNTIECLVANTDDIRFDFNKAE